jgi:hypothetical protein|tara:strand:+ start:820 stop:1125 length:306 start_codon:yes stop_codon:yes gene_type:complete
MKRYSKIDIIKKEGQRRFTETVRYPLIPPSIGDTYIVAMQGDRLDNLAYEYYKDPSLWWILARANKIGLGTLNIESGKQIRIPENPQTIIDEYNRINKKQE